MTGQPPQTLQEKMTEAVNLARGKISKVMEVRRDKMPPDRDWEHDADAMWCRLRNMIDAVCDNVTDLSQVPAETVKHIRKDFDHPFIQKLENAKKRAILAELKLSLEIWSAEMGIREQMMAALRQLPSFDEPTPPRRQP